MAIGAQGTKNSDGSLHALSIGGHDSEVRSRPEPQASGPGAAQGFRQAQAIRLAQLRHLGLVPNQVVDGLRAPIVRLLVLQATVEEGIPPWPHPNARLTPHGRRLLAERIGSGWTISAAARAAGISRQTGSKWWHRAQTDDPSSTARAPSTARLGVIRLDLVARLCARRRELRVGPHILGLGGRPRPELESTRSWRAQGLGRLDRLEPRPPVVRYERARPGRARPPRHQDARPDRTRWWSPGPGAGRSGPASRDRLEPGPPRDRRPQPAGLRRGACRREHRPRRPRFLERAWRFYADHGITIERILTDNGGCYRSRDFAVVLRPARHRPPVRLDRIGPRPTARPSGSSGRCSRSGPTPEPFTERRHVLRAWPGSSTSTITGDHIGHSPVSRR